MAKRYGAKMTVPDWRARRDADQKRLTEWRQRQRGNAPETRFETGFVAVVDRARPPVLGLDVEVDVRGLSREIVL